MKHAPATILFDVEGTLIDCVPQTLQSWQETLRRCGHDLDVSELQPYSGMDGSDLLERLLPQLAHAKKQQILKLQDECYKSSHMAGARPFPGVREMFVQLKSQNHVLGIATSCEKSELHTYDAMMDVLGLTDAFTCGDEVKRGKPHPDVLQSALNKLGRKVAAPVLMVGDSPYDAQAAASIGAGAVGVLTGGFNAATLERAGCLCVIQCATDLPAILAQVAG